MVTLNSFLVAFPKATTEAVEALDMSPAKEAKASLLEEARMSRYMVYSCFLSKEMSENRSNQMSGCVR